MTQKGPLRWRSGAGWLVLAGGGRWREGETGEIDAAVLGWANLERPVAVLLTAGGSTSEGETLLEYLADLGGPSGYIVPIFNAADAQRMENHRLLAEAGLIYIADGPDPLAATQALRESSALEAAAYAFDGGAAVVGVGAGATALGAWAADLDESKQVEPGWAWLPDIIVEPHFTGTASARRLRRLLGLHTECLGLGLPDGVALALGPDGRVETIGNGQATVVLGNVVTDQPEAEHDHSPIDG